jgi:hypothetical protein
MKTRARSRNFIDQAFGARVKGEGIQEAGLMLKRGAEIRRSGWEAVMTYEN